MRIRNGFIVLAVLLVLGGAVAIWWKSPKSKPVKKEAVQHLTPKMQVASMTISDIDADRIKLNSTIRLSNPLPVAIHAKNLQYQLYIDSMLVLKDTYKKPLSINASDSTVIHLPMELLAKPMAQVLKYFDNHKIDSADYTMKANFDMDVPVAGNRNFSMDVSKRLPALRLPKIHVKDVDLHALRLKKKGVDMVVQVTNPNLFPIKMKDGKFSLAVEDDMKMNGMLEKTINIPARGTQDVSMHADVTEGSNLLKTGWKFLARKEETQFTYNFRCKLMTENGMLSNSTMATKMQGTLAELAHAAKELK